MHAVPLEDRAALIRDKYAGNAATQGLEDDLRRLKRGEPLAYVIGWVPFLGLTIHLDSRPLIPRVETEFWTEKLILHLTKRFGDRAFRFLDLCAGSGAIGLAVLKHCPSARVSFGELSPTHVDTIWKNIRENGLDVNRAEVRAGDLFTPFSKEPTRFDVIATNPPYVPEDRVLDESVTKYEPEEALYAGADGLAVIRRIAAAVEEHLYPDGELWLECDSGHTQDVRQILGRGTIHTDQYGRGRYVVAHW